MKKKYTVSKKDKKDWNAFIKQKKRVYDKDINLSDNSLATNEVRKLDLHGFSLNDANTEAKKFIIKSYNSGYKKLIIITGKGSRSKTSDNPYVSRQMGILKNSIPEYISNDADLSNIIKNITKAICSRDFFFSLVLPCLYCLIWTMPNRITNIPQIISDK